MDRRDEAAIAFFGSWMITGLYLDGWSHLHHKPETFFTPWHGVLYSGFAAAVAYFVIRGAITGRRLEIDPVVRAGFIVFIAAAFGDFAWHSIFGIERSLAALLSPTHLALMTGGLLMIAGPIRLAMKRPVDAPTFKEFLPTLVCFTLVALVTSFFLQYDSAFRQVALWHTNIGQEGNEVYSVSTILITNALLMGMALFMRRRWRLPMGTFSFFFAAVAFAASGLDDFVPKHFVTALVAGITADLLAKRNVRIFGTVVPFVMWSTWVVVMAISYDVGWPPEIWTGAIFLATLSGLGLSLLVGADVPEVSRTSVSVRAQP